MQKIHIPVLLKETIDSLDINPKGFYIDCTLGDGGHSSEILKNLSKEGLLLSIDQDEHAIDFVKDFYPQQDNWILKRENFSKIDEAVQDIDREPGGIMMDLGLSSRQLEESHNRGFSYMEENEPLDMRMDERLGVKATDLIKVLSVKQLSSLFKEYGEERYAKRIAEEIKNSDEKIETVGDLTRLIYRVVPAGTHDFKNPSRRVFQALRIVVNDELNSLREGLDKSFEILKKGGRLSVITFHSLEDRIVKDFFNEQVRRGRGKLLFSKAIAPTDKEIEQNPRSSSAKLRTIIKN
jgi:16S rRNA (cytosine1402-N4)-methyltransferase